MEDHSSASFYPCSYLAFPVQNRKVMSGKGQDIGYPIGYAIEDNMPLSPDIGTFAEEAGKQAPYWLLCLTPAILGGLELVRRGLMHRQPHESRFGERDLDDITVEDAIVYNRTDTGKNVGMPVDGDRGTIRFPKFPHRD